MNNTRMLTSFAHGLTLDDIPERSQMHVKHAVLDTIGCMLGGASSPLTLGALRVARVLGDSGQAQIVGHADRSSVSLAALVNAFAANALDYDDGYAVDGKGIGHPSSSLVSAALAIGEWRHSSGAEVLAGLAAAYEACNRVGHAIVPTPERYAQVWAVAVHQAFGAAVVSARLMGLDENAFIDAFGLAGSLSTLPAGRKWNFETRPLFAFKDVVAPAAEAGVRAALYAAEGFTGSRDILDGNSGFWVMAGSDRCDFERLTMGLGTHWTVDYLYLKPYPACRWVHAALEACEELKREHGITAEDLNAVRVGSFADMVRSFAEREPQTPPDGQFSMPYTVAVCLAGVPVGPQWYAEETMKDPKILELAQKVRVYVDEAAEARHVSEERKTMSVVTLHTRDGREFSKRIAVARGGAEDPLSQSEREGKYYSMAVPVLGGSRAKKIHNRIMVLEELRDVSEITSLLTPS